jgi:magnesium chelatase family protein
VRGYLGRLSGPLLDRIDLHVPMPAVTFDELTAAGGEPSAAVAERVTAARRRQIERRGESGRLNSRLSHAELQRVARTGPAGERLIRAAMERGSLSARGLHRLLRVARTIADLDASQEVRPQHVAEALQFRRCVADTLEAGRFQALGEHP